MATKKTSKRRPAKARKATRRSPKTTARRKVARKTSRKAKAKVAKRSKRPRPTLRSKARMPQSSPPTKPFKMMDLEAAPRCRSRIPVEIDIDGRREHGAIVDMSASGARLVGVQVDLPPGTPLQIRYASGTAPILLAAEIVRATEDGFAVKILPR
jgi:PilZ domain-containing protein